MLFFPVFANQHPRLLTLRLKGFVSFQFASPVVPSASHCPQFPAHHPPKLFRINTYKSLSKQTTLTLIESHSYKKHRRWGVLWLTRSLLPLTFCRTNVPTFQRSSPPPVDIQPLAGHNFPSAPSPTVAPITEEGE